MKLAANAAGALGAKIKFIKLGKINVLYRIKCHVPLSSLIGALRAPPGGRGAKPPAVASATQRDKLGECLVRIELTIFKFVF